MERVWFVSPRLSLLCVREQYVFHITEMKGTVSLVMSWYAFWIVVNCAGDGRVEMGTRPSRQRWSEVLVWRLSWIRLIIFVYMGMSFAFMLFINIIFCKLVISVLRSLTIS